MDKNCFESDNLKEERKERILYFHLGSVFQRNDEKTDTRVREQILFERHEYRIEVAEVESEFICFRQFWVLLLSKVQ
jgi:hypothetical protein